MLPTREAIKQLETFTRDNVNAAVSSIWNDCRLIGAIFRGSTHQHKLTTLRLISYDSLKWRHRRQWRHWKCKLLVSQLENAAIRTPQHTAANVVASDAFSLSTKQNR